MRILPKCPMTYERKWIYGANETRATYQSWYDMRTRCLDSEDEQFSLYGGRGITVCERWRENYDAFYADMGPRPAGTTLDRIDNDQGYDPFNCRWATMETQSRNRRSNRMLTLSGRTQPLEDWASEIGIDPTTLAYRLRKGFPQERLMAPPSAKHQNFHGRL